MFNIKNSVSSIGTSTPIEIDDGLPDCSSLPIDIEEDIESDDASEPTKKKSRKQRQRSWVWPNYKLYTRSENVMVGGVMTKVEKTRAKCLHCSTGDYAYNPHSIGTKTLGVHLLERCTGFKKENAKGQTVITGDKSVTNTMVFRGFSQGVVLVALVEMIVVDEMPFSTVDKPGFRRFCSVAIPEFKIPSRRVFVKEFFRMYEDRKKLLIKELATHRVSLTTDTWTSVQNINYMVITAHFIDSEWKMHKRILGFSQIENHKGITIGKAIEACLLNWNIAKVLTITVDNASANKTALDWLRIRMNSWENSQAIMQGKFLHVRCAAHIVNLIVGHGLKMLNRSIIAIRNSVSYVRSSPQRKLDFKNICNILKISYKGSVCLDVPTRWNSTYLMLDSAIKFRKAFERMQEDDNSYRAYFDHEELDGEFDEPDDGIIAPPRPRKRVGPPVGSDWEQAAAFVDFLGLFYYITLRISSSLKPTANTCFHDVMLIESKLRELYVPITDHATQTRTDLEKTLSTMSTKMTAKYNKYFGSHNDMNQLLLVALFLDPRYKLTSVTHLLGKEGIPDYQVKIKTDELLLLVKNIYDCYKPPDSIVVPSQSLSSHNSLTSTNMSKTDAHWMVSLLGDLPVDDDNMVFKHEVDKYVSEKLEYYNLERGADFDILCWWKITAPKYPVLAAMAKDILAVQVSSVASESAFSTGGRVIDTSRSSLTPKSVEALICFQDWTRGNEIVTYIKDEPSTEADTFYEECELDLSPAESTNAG